jgi:pimeloyl-ACP methyl ester carboxylesterase
MCNQPETTSALPRPAIGESRLVRKRKNVINYFIRGAGETVILLPAFARAASDFNELVVSLNESGYRTVAVEHRGMGQSTSPIFPRANMHDFARDVADVIGSLDDLIGGKVHVLGRAFGARVARALATNHPKVVQSVILLAGGGMINITKSRLLPYILCNSPLIPEKIKLKAVRATLYAPGSKVPRHLAYHHTFRAMRRQIFALRTSLDGIWRDSPVPVLWIHGEQDRLVPLKNAIDLCDRFPEQVKLVVIPNAGHAMLPEQPEAVLKQITAFLEKYSLSEKRS